MLNHSNKGARPAFGNKAKMCPFLHHFCIDILQFVQKMQKANFNQRLKCSPKRQLKHTRSQRGPKTPKISPRSSELYSGVGLEGTIILNFYIKCCRFLKTL